MLTVSDTRADRRVVGCRAEVLLDELPVQVAGGIWNGILLPRKSADIKGVSLLQVRTASLPLRRNSSSVQGK